MYDNACTTSIHFQFIVFDINVFSDLVLCWDLSVNVSQFVLHFNNHMWELTNPDHNCT